MGAIASLQSQLVSVTPGAEARVELKVRNNGSVVDQLDISVLGDAAGWSRSEPASLSLFPGAEGTATIVFAPPREPSVPAGQMPFGIRVASQEDPAGSVVEEGRLDIAPFSAVNAELQPLTTRGSRGAHHDLAVDNRGNVALNATLLGVDDSEELRFDFRPPSVVVEPGRAAFARVDLKPRRRFWRGQPRSRSFAVQVETPDQPPVPVTGTFLQEPVLPGWLIKALLALAAAIIALLLFWFLFLQPTLLTAAEDRAREAGQEAGRQAAEEAMEEAGVGSGSESGSGGSPSPSPSPSPTPTPTPTPTPPPTPAPTPTPTPPPPTPPPTPPTLLAQGDPVAGRIRAGAQPDPAPAVPAGRTRYITDLVFSNPAAESGEVRLRRGNQVLLALRLENFRDLDFHFVTPIVFGPNDRMDLVCQDCSQAALFYTGYER